MYLDLQSYEKCPRWERGEAQDENGVQLGREKMNAGLTKRQELSTLTCLARSIRDVGQNTQAPTNQLFC